MIHVRGERGDNPRCWLWVCVTLTTLAHHVDEVWMREAYRRITARGHPAVGTAVQYCVKDTTLATLLFSRSDEHGESVDVPTTSEIR